MAPKRERGCYNSTHYTQCARTHTKYVTILREDLFSSPSIFFARNLCVIGGLRNHTAIQHVMQCMRPICQHSSSSSTQDDDEDHSDFLYCRNRPREKERSIRIVCVCDVCVEDNPQTASNHMAIDGESEQKRESERVQNSINMLREIECIARSVCSSL